MRCAKSPAQGPVTISTKEFLMSRTENANKSDHGVRWAADHEN
jgi:hypothetical protein